MNWRNFFKGHLNPNPYKNYLLSILGWEKFCDCGQEDPYLHTHPKLTDSIECACGKLANPTVSVFGRPFSSPWKQVKYYKCSNCKKDIDISFYLIFKII